MKHAIWTQRLLADIQQSLNKKEILVYCDNDSSFKLVHNPEYHARTKYIDIQYHFIRDEFEKGTVKFEFCSTANMSADGITKLLSRPAFKDKIMKIGVINLQKIRITTEEEC